MLSLGIGELIVIAALLILVVGPERLPHVMRWVGRTYGQVRRAADDMRRAFVLEADRQDAEERYQRMFEERRKLREERERLLAAQIEAGEHTAPEAPASQGVAFHDDLPPPRQVPSAPAGPTDASVAEPATPPREPPA